MSIEMYRFEPCRLCNGTGNVETPSRLCLHADLMTVPRIERCENCKGTGEIEIPTTPAK